MSALAPENGKYRRSWLLWGSQAIPSEQYKTNYDQIKWGKVNKNLVKEELTSPSHYRLRFEGSDR